MSRFWPISKPQVYSELRRLEAQGLVEGNDVAQEKLPDKRVFRLTPAGERALDAWLVDDAEVEASRFRIPFLVKTLVAHRIPGERVRELLCEYRRAADAEHDALQELDELLAGTSDAVFARATVLFGLRMSAAIGEWAQEVDSLLPQEPIRIDPRRRKPGNALRLLDSLPGRRSARSRR